MAYALFITFFAVFVLLDLGSNALTLRVHVNKEGGDVGRESFKQGTVKWLLVDFPLSAASAIVLPVAPWKWALICTGLCVCRIRLAYLALSEDQSTRVLVATAMGALAILGYFLPFMMIASRHLPKR